MTEPMKGFQLKLDKESHAILDHFMHQMGLVKGQKATAIRMLIKALDRDTICVGCDKPHIVSGCDVGMYAPFAMCETAYQAQLKAVKT